MADDEPTPRRRGRTLDERLSRDDWAAAALQALVREGPQGLNVQRLARRLHVARASFYWHFEDRDDLLRAALDLWERRATHAYIARLECIADPRARLRRLVREAFAHEGAGREFVALAATLGDPLVQAAMARALEARFEFLCRTFTALGLTPAQARHRAAALNELYIGIWHAARAVPGGFGHGRRRVTLAAHLRFLEQLLVP